MKLFLIKVRNKINKILAPLVFYVFRVFPINNHKVLVESFAGKGYGGNSKYVVEALLEQNVQNDIVWVTKNKENLPNSVRSVKPYSLKWIYELSTARVWINNMRFSPYIRKRKNQYYIQLWHGWIALKKIEYDVFDKLEKYYQKSIKNDNSMIDVMISNGKKTTEFIRKSFKYKGKILEFGTPRNDVLVKNNPNLRKQVLEKLNIDEDSNLLLYAPTFRNTYSNNNPYDVDLIRIKKILENKSKEKWVILMRLHPNVADKKLFTNYSKDIINATNFPNIQELLCVSNLAITDYSSIMFDCMFSNVPVILYASDLNKYLDERGFYYSLNKLPFPLFENNDKLCAYLENNNWKKIVNNYKLMKDDYIEDGNSSIRVAELINQVIEKYENK